MAHDMDVLENVLDVPEGSAAILYDTGEYHLFFADVKKGISDVPTEVKSGNGVRNLRTRGIRTCGGVMYQNETNFVLVHGLNDDNLRALLDVVNPLSIENAGGKPKKTYLCTPNGWADYGKVIQDSLGESVPVKYHHMIDNPNCTFQDASIGKDILDVDDGYTPPLRSSAPSTK
jgi:hypothetical protein